MIETKNYSGEVRCYGDRWRRRGRRRTYDIASVSRQAQYGAAYVKGLLKGKGGQWVSVTPVCVFPNPEAILRLSKPSVPVLRLTQLADFICGAVVKRETVSDSEVRLICTRILSMQDKGSRPRGTPSWDELRKQAHRAAYQAAVKDPLFLKDVREIEADFRCADAETAERIDQEEQPSR